jgi:prepilin peptidase CpaA
VRVNVVRTISFTFIDYYLVFILILCAIIDCYTHKIPNLLTYPTIIFALLYNFFYHGIDGLLFSIAGLFLGIIILGVFYIFGVMGAGDVKLMGAVGAVLGTKNVLNAFLFTGIIGGIYAIIVIMFRFQASKKLLKRIITTLKTLSFTGNFVPIPAGEDEKPLKLCYGIAIALGALITIWLKAVNYNLPI